MTNRAFEDKRVQGFTNENSEHLGKIFYVCDFRKDINQSRAFRDLKPTKAILVSVIESNKKYKEKKSLEPKVVYFSKNVFVPLDKNGVPNYTKPIPIFDNTGNQYTSFALFAFSSLEEANDKYNELVDFYIDELEEEKKVVLSKIDSKIKDAKGKRV